MKIYLLRHGHRGHGENQDFLTEIGIEQSRRTAEFFKNIKIDKVICGDKQRARKTAELIIQEKGCRVEYTSEVNEQEMGIFEGKPAKEWKEEIEKSGLTEQEFRPKGGENRADAYSRAKKFYKRLQREKVENLLIVSHAGFISDLITLFLGLPEKENIHFKKGFCAISYFELDEDFKVIDFYIGDLTHLGKYVT